MTTRSQHLQAARPVTLTATSQPYRACVPVLPTEWALSGGRERYGALGLSALPRPSGAVTHCAWLSTGGHGFRIAKCVTVSGQEPRGWVAERCQRAARGFQGPGVTAGSRIPFCPPNKQKGQLSPHLNPEKGPPTRPRGETKKREKRTRARCTEERARHQTRMLPGVEQHPSG